MPRRRTAATFDSLRELQIKGVVLDFNQEWHRQLQAIHNCFVIGIEGDDAPVVKSQKGNAQNEVVSTFLCLGDTISSTPTKTAFTRDAKLMKRLSDSNEPQRPTSDVE